jgi:prohibitin 1
LYTSGRDLVAVAVEQDLAVQLRERERGFDNVQILLREILLPPQISQAIEEKLQAEQQSEKMRFVLDKETQEAERKRIEASGIADFQTIVSDGISEKLLRWKGIEATETLANSGNAKVIVIGGSDGLPLILNSQ